MDSDFQHPSDGWYMIEAMGRFPNARANAVQIIDDKACQSIVQNFNKEAAAPGFPGMLIDIEHFKHDDEKETRAYGWLMRLQKRDDGIYGQIRWTNTGREAVDGGSYRFFSSEFDLRDLENLGEKGGKKLFRPLRLDGLTLTNTPNNAQGQRPITNRESVDIDNREHSPRVKAAILSQLASELSAAAKAEPSVESHQAALDANSDAVDALQAAGADPFQVKYHVQQAARHDAEARKLGGQSEQLVNNRNTDSEFMKDQNSSADALDASSEANALSGSADSPSQHEEAASAHRKAETLQRAAGHTGTADYHAAMAAKHDSVAGSMRGAPPSGDDDGMISEQDAALCNRLVLEHAKAAGLSYGDARMNILRERPELFRPVRPEIRRTRYHDVVEAQMAEGARMANRRAIVEEIDGETLAEQADEIAACQYEEKCSYIQARDLVRNRRPDLFGITYVHQGNFGTPTAAEETADEAAEREGAIQQYRIKNRVSYCDALDAVRNRRPELFGLPSNGSQHYR